VSLVPKKKRKYKKLTKREQKLASKYIAEEFRTRRYPPEQAKAIGISRAKAKLAEIRKRHRIR
jgi:hypothetical protein